MKIAMSFIKASLFYIAAALCYVASSPDVIASPHKSKEEPLAVFQSFHDSLAEKHPHRHVPPQVKSFAARKESRRDISKIVSSYVKNTITSELVGGGDNKNKASLKGKVARFLVNQKKNKMLSKMRRNTNTKDGNKVNGRRRTNRLTEFLSSTMESLSDGISSGDDGVVSSRTHDDNYYKPPAPTIFYRLNQVSTVMIGLNQTEYTEKVEGLTSVIGSVTNIPSPEEFCADFDVTTTEEECVGAVSAVTTLIKGAIQAPWLLRDIVGYAEAAVNEVVAWEIVEGLASGILSIYGADGTIEGSFGAIRGLMADVFAFIAAVDPYFSVNYPDLTDFGGLMLDFLPMIVATEALVWDYNFLKDFGDNLYDTVYHLVQDIEDILGKGYIDLPEGSEFDVDVCKAFDLVPANVTTLVSCDYFGDIGQVAIPTEDVPFCVKYGQDMEDYSAELFHMESTFDIRTLQEANMGWIVQELQYNNWKFDNYNFTALESMTCSIKGYLTQELKCDEKPLNTFLWKDGVERTCRWLRKREHTDKICDQYYTVRYACPSTCCMCNEDSMATFFRRYIEEDNGIHVPETRTCKWLSMRSPIHLDKFCRQNFAPGNLKTASGACPVTCGLCEGRDECQDAIENYIATTTWVNHYNNTTYESVYWYSYGEGGSSDGTGQYSYMYYFDRYGNYKFLGYYQERDENTFILDGGDYCEEEDRSISSKVIVEGTKEFGGDGIYFSQSSPCSYELKVFVYCGDDITNTTNTISFHQSSRNLFQTLGEHFYPQPEDEKLDWQK